MNPTVHGSTPGVHDLAGMQHVIRPRVVSRSRSGSVAGWNKGRTHFACGTEACAKWRAPTMTMRRGFTFSGANLRNMLRKRHGAGGRVHLGCEGGRMRSCLSRKNKQNTR